MTSLSHQERLLLEAEAARQQARDVSRDPDAARARLSAQLEAAGGLPAEPVIPVGDSGAIGPQENPREGLVDDGPRSPMIDRVREAGLAASEAGSWNQAGVETSSPALAGARSWGGAQPAPTIPLAAAALETPADSAARAPWSDNRPLNQANWTNSLAPRADAPANPEDAWSTPAAAPSIAAQGNEALGAFDFPRAPAACDADRLVRDPATAFDGGLSPRSAWTSPLVSAAPTRGSHGGPRADASDSGASLAALLDDLEKLRTAARRTAQELERIRGPVQPALPAMPPNHGSFRI